MRSFSFKILLLLITVCLFSASFNSSAQDSTTNRIIRYQPDEGDFVIKNGKIKFNRSLYGVNTEFRVEAGDLPEFALYLPGMGGNLKLALAKGNQAIWLTDAAQIETRYRPGSMIYTVSDPMLVQGKIVLTMLAMADEEGFVLKTECEKCDGVRLFAVYGGASNEVFRRAGERNVDAADCFFLKAKNCKGNEYELNKNAFSLKFGKNTVIAGGSHLVDKVPVDGRVLKGTFPESAVLKVIDFNATKSALALNENKDEVKLPVLCAETVLKDKQTLYFSVYNPTKYSTISNNQLPKMLAEAESYRQSLISRIKINTPDNYLNAFGGALAVAADGIWQDPSYLHGAISWRVRIPGWRAAYAATALGWFDRAKTHFEAYANSQLTSPESGPVEMDTAMSFGRVKMRIGNSLFSSGYICPNPNSQKLASLSFYDMNLVYIDELLRNIFNTGDLSFAKKMWPTIRRHLAWEKRTFDADGDGLYDAFACIWASDALQYSGGGVAHSSAYNYFHNKCAAQLAALIGQDAKPYLQESEKILKAINSKLWLKDKGQYAEFVEVLGAKTTHESAGLWTVYHSIDSEIADQFQEYQALRYVDTQIPHIPFKVSGLDEHFDALTTTNWMPYYWSINNVAPAEQFHTALAYWQGGRNEEAYRLFKSMMMDHMFCGSSPGNFPMLSVYNAASRNESYRDFADVIGIAARTLVEGLIGYRPDAVNGKAIIRPGLPAKWDFASFSLPYLDFDFNYARQKSNYTITQKREKLLTVNLQIPAKTDQVASVKLNGKAANYKLLTENVGCPMLEIVLPSKATNKVTIAWAGKSIDVSPKEINATYAETKTLDLNAPIVDIKDPQSILSEQKINGTQLHLKINGEPGNRTFFAQLKQGEMSWWQPVHVNLSQAVEIVSGDTEDAGNLNFYLKNNSEKTISGRLTVGKNSGNAFVRTLTIQPNSRSESIQVPAGVAVFGTNAMEFTAENGQTYIEQLVNWTLPLKTGATFENVTISSAFNDKVNNIFAPKKYLSPRSPYTTLQLPLQGMGDWCVPLRMVTVNDSGFRAAAKNDLFETAFGLKFTTPASPEKPNIAFSSLFDNYPDSVSVLLSGKASHAYLLMAGSSNHMQSRIENGRVTVRYADGSESVLKLINPETWAPIERDYFSDDFSYKMNRPRPYRVVLKTGLVARNLEKELIGAALDARLINGGGAILLDLPLEANKELKSLTLTTKANEVVIGLMGVTLERKF